MTGAVCGAKGSVEGRNPIDEFAPRSSTAVGPIPELWRRIEKALAK